MDYGQSVPDHLKSFNTGSYGLLRQIQAEPPFDGTAHTGWWYLSAAGTGVSEKQQVPTALLSPENAEPAARSYGWGRSCRTGG